MLPLHWQRLLSVFELGEQSDFSFPPKTQHQRIWVFFQSAQNLFPYLMYLAREILFLLQLLLCGGCKSCVQYLFCFFFYLFLPGLHRMRVRLRCACAPSGVVGDSYRLHLECCMVLDAGVSYQPDTQTFKLSSVQKHPNEKTWTDGLV